MNLKELRESAGDDVAQDAMYDLAEELAEERSRADRFFRGEHEVQCTCAPPHQYRAREARCPRYVELLESIAATAAAFCDETLYEEEASENGRKLNELINQWRGQPRAVEPTPNKPVFIP